MIRYQPGYNKNMGKTAIYQEKLKVTENWDQYLLEYSGLPGPRANLELMYAVAELGDENLFLRYCAIPADKAPTNSPQVFLTCCGIVGLGKLINSGKVQYLQVLRNFASDERWRVREAVAMALQLVGDNDIHLLLGEVQTWKTGNLLEQRAVVAALCEPRLLKNKLIAGRVLDILDEITQALSLLAEKKSDDYIVLKKALSYGWSVAVVADPENGKKLLEKWIDSHDPVTDRIMKENLKKDRLTRMDKTWVIDQQKKYVI
jgi:hypothetical protein